MYRNDIITIRFRSIVASALILMLVSMPSTAAGGDNQTEITSKPEGFVLVPLKQSITGDWRLVLEDNETRYANLTLYQANDVILGYGNLTSDNSTRKVTAGGSLEGDLLDLLFISEEEDLILRLVFSVDEECISGDYRGYIKDGEEIRGNGSGCMYVHGDTASPIGPKPSTPIEWPWLDWALSDLLAFDFFP